MTANFWPAESTDAPRVEPPMGMSELAAALARVGAGQASDRDLERLLALAGDIEEIGAGAELAGLAVRIREIVAGNGRGAP